MTVASRVTVVLVPGSQLCGVPTTDMLVTRTSPAVHWGLPPRRVLMHCCPDSPYGWVARAPPAKAPTASAASNKHRPEARARAKATGGQIPSRHVWVLISALWGEETGRRLTRGTRGRRTGYR